MAHACPSHHRTMNPPRHVSVPSTLIHRLRRRISRLFCSSLCAVGVQAARARSGRCWQGRAERVCRGRVDGAQRAHEAGACADHCMSASSQWQAGARCRGRVERRACHRRRSRRWSTRFEVRRRTWWPTGGAAERAATRREQYSRRRCAAPRLPRRIWVKSADGARAARHGFLDTRTSSPRRFGSHSKSLWVPFEVSGRVQCLGVDLLREERKGIGQGGDNQWEW